MQGLQADLSDAELAVYLLQLVQVVRTEAYLVNPLTLWLVGRGLSSPRVIGVRLCWHLRAHLESCGDARLRFSLLLDALCRGVGPQLLDLLGRQVSVLNRLTRLAISVKVGSLRARKRGSMAWKVYWTLEGN